MESLLWAERWGTRPDEPDSPPLRGPAVGRRSAGVVVYRHGDRGLEFFLVHPGGPFWAQKDVGAWSIPKGELDPDEDPLAAARRELEEETGARPTGPFVALTPIRQKGGKEVVAWAVEGDLEPDQVRSNTFTMEWPPRSGRMQEFPEVDRAAWFTMSEAADRINPAQLALLEEAGRRLEAGR